MLRSGDDADPDTHADDNYADADADVVNRHHPHQLDEPGSPAAPDGLGHSLDLRTPHHDPNLRVTIIAIIMIISNTGPVSSF